MIILTGVSVMIAVAYLIYRAMRELLTDDPATDPTVKRLGADGDILLPAAGRASLAAAAEEERERVLVRDLVAGRIDASDYRRQMSELAHTHPQSAG